MFVLIFIDDSRQFNQNIWKDLWSNLSTIFSFISVKAADEPIGDHAFWDQYWDQYWKREGLYCVYNKGSSKLDVKGGLRERGAKGVWLLVIPS